MTTSSYAARLRAARAYADLTREPVAEALGVSLRTLSRLEAGELHSTVEQRRIVANLTGAPDWFLEHDFEGATLDGAEPSVRDRVEALESEVGTLRGQHRELREARQQVADLTEELRTLQRGIAEAVAAHVEEFVLRRAGELPGAPDEEPRPGRREGS